MYVIYRTRHSSELGHLLQFHDDAAATQVADFGIITYFTLMNYVLYINELCTLHTDTSFTREA